MISSLPPVPVRVFAPTVKYHLLPQPSVAAKVPTGAIERGRVSSPVVPVARILPASEQVIHCRSYCIPSWFDSAGVAKKRKIIEAKGLPNFHNWRFITLTFSRGEKDSDGVYAGGLTPLAAYLAGSDYMRRFLDKARKAGLWDADAKWCWKFEFQKDGWPHWHLLVDQRKKYTFDQLRQLTELWTFGRVDVQRVRAKKKFRYDFKYAFKSASLAGGDEDGMTEYAPGWFLDYFAKKIVTVKWTDGEGVAQVERVEKPCSFARVRFWQTSRGFYTGVPVKVPPSPPPAGGRAVRTVREILLAQLSTVQVIARRGSGDYLASMVVPLSCSLRAFWDLVGFEASTGGAVGLSCYSFLIPTHRIETDKNTSWKLNQLVRKNRLSLRRALVLRRRGEKLQRR